MNYPGIRIEGGILSSDILQVIEGGETYGQLTADFSLNASEKVKDEIARSWAASLEYYRIFKRKVESLTPEKSGVTETRNIWIIPFLTLLGYNLEYTSQGETINERTYRISHRDNSRGLLPVHIAGINEDIDKKVGDTRISPHGMLQEYLNITEHLYGIVTNGKVLRILRNSSRLVKLTYVEFDLERIFDDALFSDFALLFRLLHASRFPLLPENGSESIIEKYHQDTIASGERIREDLSSAVKKAIESLATGFISHPENIDLHKELSDKSSIDTFYHEILTIVYRLLFVMVIEERNLVISQKISETRYDEIYKKYYSVERLRIHSSTYHLRDKKNEDSWYSLLATFALFDERSLGIKIGISPLAGELFSSKSITTLENLKIKNIYLLNAIRHLSYFEGSEGSLNRINYSALSVEEFGSVYEGLLDYRGEVIRSGNTFDFLLVPDFERKSTGSYYTPAELVGELITSALKPVVDKRLTGKITREEKEKILLETTVCDPACGSGHFLLAAARYLARTLAFIRSNGDEPSASEHRHALRDVITHCVYGVDKNPRAIELCRIALWLESHEPGKPLSFLDHHIKCGDSLVGVMSFQDIENGIPDEAFIAVTGDDKKIASEIKKYNHIYKKGDNVSLFKEASVPRVVIDDSELGSIDDDTLESIKKKTKLYEKMHSKESPYFHAISYCNLWTAAFFSKLTLDAKDKQEIVTNETFFLFLNGYGVDVRYTVFADKMQYHNRFFHWYLEFPQVFNNGGFDCVLGNPPWERIKLQEKEFFASRDNKIADAVNKSEREKLIQALKNGNPELLKEFADTLHTAESSSRFIRSSGRFPLAGRGDVNTYAVFAELILKIKKAEGCAGIIVPTGIATDDTTKFYFQHIVDSNLLVSLFDFENRNKIFPGIDSRIKFSLLTLGHVTTRDPEFVFFALSTDDLKKSEKRFSLSKDDISLINPNTRTCPIFRSSRDAEITKNIYRRIPVLVDENKKDGNPWGVKFTAMFHMSNDSHLFKTKDDLSAKSFTLQGNIFVKEKERFLPLYEAKMFHHYDHRWATYDGEDTRDVTIEEKKDLEFVVMSRYWVAEKEVNKASENYDRQYFLAFRDITNTTNERTSIFSIIPRVAVGHKAPIVIIEKNRIPLFQSIFTSFILDYFIRQKMGGTSFTYFYLKQYPVLNISLFTNLHKNYVLPRVLELTYTSLDLKPFAADLWQNADNSLRELITTRYNESSAQSDISPKIDLSDDGIPFPPFPWNEDRRFSIRCELDALYFHLYGINRDDVEYIMETFPIIKKKDLSAYGSFRTKEKILELYDGMTGSLIK